MNKDGIPTSHPGGKRGTNVVALALALSFVPLANLLYYIPYAIRGIAEDAFVEVGGVVLFYFVNPVVGCVTALVFLALLRMTGSSRKPGLSRMSALYLIVLAVLAVGYLVFGLTDVT